MDPHAALGVRRGASPDEVAAAYRRLAKRLHPDRRPGDQAAARRMAEVNAAYAALQRGVDGPRAAPPPEAGEPAPTARPGSWLPDDIRRALGAELLRALDPGEGVLVVTDAVAWDSHRIRLAVTDRRLLWLRDDAPIDRVRWLRFAAIATAQGRLRGRRRRSGELVVEPRDRRRTTFAEIDPDALRAVVLALRRSIPAAA